VNAIASGAIYTEANEDNYIEKPGLQDLLGSQTVLGRSGEASDIG
jgi:hypothetical protein